MARNVIPFLISILIISSTAPLVESGEGNSPESENQGTEGENDGSEVKVITPEVLSTVPHDTTAFTQGLEIHNGKFYESTGLYGESSVRIVNMTTGEVELQRDLPDEYFGEGLTIWNDSVIQLTWRENTGFIYDLETLELIGNFSYPGEGWGLCSDRNNNLWMSDGGATLKQFSENLSSFEEEEIEIRVNGRVMDRWNELHCDGYVVYANRWYDDSIYQIHTDTGKVCQKVDFSAIREQFETEDSGVLNGIAWDPESRSWWVTGKNWSNYYQVKIGWEPLDPYNDCTIYPPAQCGAMSINCGVSYWMATDGFGEDVREILEFVLPFLLIGVPMAYLSKRQTEKPPPTSEEE